MGSSWRKLFMLVEFLLNKYFYIEQITLLFLLSLAVTAQLCRNDKFICDTSKKPNNL